MSYQYKLVITLMMSMFGFFSNYAMAGDTDSNSCPSTKFSEFLSVYMENPSIQQRFTNSPLKKIITVDAEPEPEQKTVLLDKDKVVFPVIFGKEKRVAAGVEVAVLENSNGVAKIKIEKPDTDYQVFYVFKFEGCWFLDEVQDYSL
ncbi:hypothetical protein [Pseudomonas sp. BW7P1]|uniref:hypothetical protein n=1 Tax=Pseudomonas TaxID=286 RepID=UPI0021AD61FF|nr:hypothetical protein [Pseudomonas sp. BW7P1]UWI61872.1 hypothetical protein NWV16_00290 [Pseudomonas sp. BW7P1]